MKNLRFFFAGLALAGLTYACDSDDDNDDASSLDDAELLRTAAAVDRINEQDFQMAFETANDESALDSRPGSSNTTSSVSCATVTQTSAGTGFPLTFEIDFGSGCTHNGITRSGSLTITFTGYLLAQGSQLIITRNNYTVNGYEVEGTVTYTNLTDSDGPEWSRSVTGGQITTPDGDTYTYSGSHTIRQTEGAGTIFNVNDNVYAMISGNATVSRPNGSSVTATVTTALEKRHDCAYISEGVVELQGAFLDGDLNYGAGTCDNLAVYTHSDGTTFNIELD